MRERGGGRGWERLWLGQTQLERIFEWNFGLRRIINVNSLNRMKSMKKLTVALLSLCFVAGPFAGIAAETKKEARPYKLTTCAVTDEKLGDMGKPFVFVHEGQEIKLCCKSCKKDFDKDPNKFLKKMAEAEKKAAASGAKN